MKVHIEKKSEEYYLEAVDILKKKVVRYGKGGAHITMPIKHLDRDTTILIHPITKNGPAMAAIGLAAEYGKEAGDIYINQGKKAFDAYLKKKKIKNHTL